MTTMPALDALRPQRPNASAIRATPQEPRDFILNETCSVLVGWKRRDAVLRLLSSSRAVIGGITGLRPGHCVRLVLYRGQTIVRECRVIGASLQGLELEHYDTGVLATMG
ncbi:hypothetical protein AAFN86_28845 [Roseomonas sp. CAU 1739]|uniref:hypothetical protein n=1 Tax=Roseomonas sp. CAU 1739 TaxID=3140364 RepID=UPI00325BC6AD